CAGELAALGAKDRASRDRAEELRVEAARETAAEVAAARVREALREGNLREAQKQLRSIGPDSVYWTGASAALRAAEAHAIDDKLRPTSDSPASETTENPCDAMDVDHVLAQATDQYAAGFARAALQLLTKALSCKQDIRMYRMAGVYACAAHEAGSARV